MKSEWVKAYMAEHGCSKQAAYKAWAKSQPSQPIGKPLSQLAAESQPKSQPSEPDSIEVRLTQLEEAVALLQERLAGLDQRTIPLVNIGGALRSNPTILDAVGPPRTGGKGKIEMPKMLPHKSW